MESMPNNINTSETDVVIPLKCFSNFWRFLDLSLTNCETDNAELYVFSCYFVY